MKLLHRSQFLESRVSILIIFLLILCPSILGQQSSSSSSMPVVPGLDFGRASEVDPEYKKIFDACDLADCKSDPSLLKALLRFGDDAIYFDAKMALDLDGSSVACNCHNNIGKYDQCNTSYKWKSEPASYAKTDRLKRCQYYKDSYFIDSAAIPYIVVPGGLSDNVKFAGGKENFVGDLGVVIYGDKVIPVIVAETGPPKKIGEGSAALLREMGEDRCKPKNSNPCTAYTIAGSKRNAKYFVFPNSKIPKSELNKSNAVAKIRVEALKRFDSLKAAYPKN